MIMDEILKLALTAFLGGGLGAAIISACNERWKFKAQRQAAKEDREAEKADRTEEISDTVGELQEAEDERNRLVEERFKNMEEQISVQAKAMQLILLDHIFWLGQSYIDKGEISYDDRRRLRNMYDCYHNGLKGNGDADLIMKGVDSLPLKHRNEVSDHADQS